MHPVACRTLSLVNGGMLVNRGFNGCINSRVQLLMASGTEFAAFFNELKRVVGTVRVVAIAAVLTHRRMNILHAEFILAVLMAPKTKLSLFRRGDEQMLMLAGMGPMTGYTVSGAHGPMPMGFGKDLGLMAVEAEAADTGTVPTQLKTHRGFMGVMAIDTAVLYRFVHYRIGKLLLHGLMTHQAKTLAGSLHCHGIEGAVRVVAGNTEPGAHRPMHVGGLAHIGMAFPCGAIGRTRHNPFEIILTTTLLVTFLTIQDHGITVDVIAFVVLGGGLSFLRRPIKNLHLLLKLIGAQGNDIFSFPEGNHRTKGAAGHRHDSAGSPVAHAVKGNALDHDSADGAGQEKLLCGHPCTIKRRNHGYLRLRGQGWRRGAKNSNSNKN